MASDRLLSQKEIDCVFRIRQGSQAPDNLGRAAEAYDFRRPEERSRMLHLINPALVKLDARLVGTTLSVEQILKLQSGDVLQLDYPVQRALNLVVNGTHKFLGDIATDGKKRFLRIEAVCSGE